MLLWIPLVLGGLAFGLGAGGLLLALVPGLRQRFPALWRQSLWYALAGGLLLLPTLGWLAPMRGEGVPEAEDLLVSVTLTSDPEGADVYLGQRMVGQTPLTLELPRGTQVSYRVQAGQGVRVAGRFAPYEASLVPEKDMRMSIWLDRLY